MLHENGHPPNHTAGGINMNFFPLGHARAPQRGVLHPALVQGQRGLQVRAAPVHRLPDREALRARVVHRGRPLAVGQAAAAALRPARLRGRRLPARPRRRRDADPGLDRLRPDLRRAGLRRTSSSAARSSARASAGSWRSCAGCAGRTARSTSTSASRSRSRRRSVRPIPSAEPDPDEHNLALQKLAFEVCVRINAVTPITPVSLVTLALLGTGGVAQTVPGVMLRLKNLLHDVRAARPAQHRARRARDRRGRRARARRARGERGGRPLRRGQRGRCTGSARSASSRPPTTGTR